MFNSLTSSVQKNLTQAQQDLKTNLDKAHEGVKSNLGKARTGVETNLLRAHEEMKGNLENAQNTLQAKHEYLKEYMSKPSEYEETKSFSSFVKKYLGYPLERHVYSTKDGYINVVHRIPGKKGTKTTIEEPL